MKKILGLDLGTNSIGWALVDRDSNKILGIGSRIIPYVGDEGKNFVKGMGESRNAMRTKARTARKGYDRYQLRRRYLIDTLKENGMMPDENLKSASKMQLWELRDKAVTVNISKQELGRLLLWFNQKRGYKSSRSDTNQKKEDTEYVKEVRTRYDRIKSLGFTIGQYFYDELRKNEYFRVKDNIFPREAYIEEFDKVCAKQKEYLNLTDELIAKIRNEIIYYQRPLKSQKGLVSVCEFEGFWTKKNDKEFFVGPKVAPKSSPLFQVAKIWENINNIKLSSKQGEKIELTLEEKQKVFEHLDNNEKLTVTDLFKILRRNKNDFTVTKQIEKGIQGNVTKNAIAEILGRSETYRNLFKLDLNIIETDRLTYLYSKKTGEVLDEKSVKYIDSKIENEPFYQLWHTIYSINDMQECSNALRKRFGIDIEIANKLATIDFSKYAFGNKSVKVIRKILPYLMEGDMYSEAMSYAGYNHSDSLTKSENLERKLLDKLKPIEKNSLRQPIVEKILNQMVNVVNSIIEEYGKPDEIRIELARELKQSKEERNDTDKKMNRRRRENQDIEKCLAEYGLRATRNNIIKWRLYQEINNQDKKLNAICVYCGQPITMVDAIRGTGVEVEHIIPKSRLFDDSQSNKTLAHRHCNSKKNDMTAYDFMKTKSEPEFEEYVERVNSLFSNKLISRSKRDKLLMSEDKIPNDFIDRQLRETQYISRKAREILQSICSQVWSTSGTVTAELRRLWGWDDVMMNLQMPKYKELGLTEIREWESEHGQKKHLKEVIKDWTKRDDHRHHAVDALTIAFTEQGFIQRFNTLNASKTREDMQREIDLRSKRYREKLSLLQKYIVSQTPIDVAEVEKAVSGILISFKSGKKAAVLGKRRVERGGVKKVVQSCILVPRGALSEDSVYGKIKMIEKEKTLKYLFENPHLIVSQNIRCLVVQRLEKFDGNPKKALVSLNNEPIYLNEEKSKILGHASCFKDEFVKKYDVNVEFNKIEKVIDGRVKEILQSRLSNFGGNPKEAFKDVQKNGKSLKWYEDEGLERPIHSVRCLTGLSSVVPVKKDDSGNEIGFVKPGNNHHIAIYTNKEGGKLEYAFTFWHAVERKKYGIPLVIKNTNEVWDKILQTQEGTYSQGFLEELPPVNLELSLSMQQNEMFILGMAEEDIKAAVEKDDYRLISEHLYRVQSISTRDYWFRHHLETQIIDDTNSKKSKRFIRVQSVNALFSLTPFKVRIDCLGRIKPLLP